MKTYQRVRLAGQYQGIPNRFGRPQVACKGIYGFSLFETTEQTMHITGILYCFCACIPLVDYLLSDIEESVEDEMVAAFIDIVGTQWMENYQMIVPKLFRQIVERAVGRDSKQVLDFVLNKLAAQLKKEVWANTRDDNLTADKINWKNHLVRNSSIVTDLFCGQVKQEKKCVKCGYTDQTYEIFRVLDVKMEGRIQHIVEALFRKETARWVCENCHSSQNSEIKVSPWKLPPILICSVELQSNQSLEFPFSKLDFSSRVTQKQKPIYDLFAIIDKRQYASVLLNNAWFQYSKINVNRIDRDQIRENPLQLLFYYQSQPVKYFHQSISLPQNWPHSPKEAEVAKVVPESSIVLNKRLSLDDVMGRQSPPSMHFK